VNVWTDKSTYAVGETLRVYYTVSQSAYIYLYDIQSDGIVRLVFPNAYSQSNFVSAGTHVLPDHSSYQYSVTYPTGLEKLQIFASPVPLSLTPNAYGEPFPMTTPGEIQGRIMGIMPTPTWVTAWVSFTVNAPPSYGYSPPAYGYTPPYGYPPSSAPFYGWPGGYWCFGPDGKWHFSIRIRIGGN